MKLYRKRKLMAWMNWIGALIFIVAAAFLPFMQVKAEVNPVNITIVKQVFDNETPENKQNTGLEMGLWGEPLAGAEFTIYDVTDRYHTLLATENPNSTAVPKENYTAKEAAQKITEEGNQGYSALEVGVTNTEGKYTFTDLPKIDSQRRNAAYLIVETNPPQRDSDSDELIIETAQNMVVTCPFYEVKVDANGNPTGEYGDVALSEIFLYPKNVRYEGGDKILEETKNDFDIGSLVHYSMELDVPINMATAQYTTFGFDDEATEGLSFNKIEGFDRYNEVTNQWESITLTQNTDYNLTVSGTNGLTNASTGDNHFSVRFALDKGILNYVGQKIRARFTMTLNELSQPDQPETNKGITLLEDNDNRFVSEHETEEIFTGGRKFIKVNGQTGKALTDALFVLQKNSGGNTLYAQFQTENGTRIAEYDANPALVPAKIVWGSKANATNFRSDSNGKFEVRGLAYSDANTVYAMEEVQAPKDYVLLKAPVEFTVGQYTYNDTRVGIDPGDRLDGDQEIKNTPKGFLPFTGGMGIYGFLAIGAAMILTAWVWQRKTKKTSR